MALVQLAVSEPATPTADAYAELRGLHEARVAAEVLAADARCPGSDVIGTTGDIAARVIVVKGLPGPAEAAGGHALSGADGEAVHKALSSLGWRSEDVFCTLSRASAGCDAESVARRLRAVIEAVDPELVILLDGEAVSDFSAGYGVEPPAWGVEVRVHGRRVVAVDGLERSLGDDGAKRRVWNQLRSACPPSSVY